MQDLPPVVADGKKTVQNAKRERWDSEEVHRGNGFAMVSEERQPSLQWIWISRSSSDPSRDTPFRDIEPELEQFAVNARRSPGRILGNHTEGQGIQRDEAGYLLTGVDLRRNGKSVEAWPLDRAPCYLEPTFLASSPRETFATLP
jgi:hypothetical protein